MLNDDDTGCGVWFHNIGRAEKANGINVSVNYYLVLFPCLQYESLAKPFESFATQIVRCPNLNPLRKHETNKRFQHHIVHITCTYYNVFTFLLPVVTSKRNAAMSCHRTHTYAHRHFYPRIVILFCDLRISFSLSFSRYFFCALASRP